MAPPAVSIILTVFKRTEFLPAALQSALDQSFQDFEIIVADDSASAAVRAICEGFQSDRIRYLANPEQKGVALNLRGAVAEARGRYISVLNDDDLWEPEFLARLVPPLDEDKGRVLSFSDHWVIDGVGDIHVDWTDKNSAQCGRTTLPRGDVAEFAELVLVRNGVPLAMAAVFRADAFDWGRLVKEVSGAYDFWISCLLVASGGRAFYVPERLTRYRVHGAMETTRRAVDKHDNQLYINEALLAEPAFVEHRALLTDRHAAALYQVGKDRLQFGLPREARTFLQRSLAATFDKKALLCLWLTYLPAPLRAAVFARASG